MKWLAAALLLAGCTGDELTSSGPAVALQKQTATGCYATMTPDDPSPALGLTDSCGHADPTLIAGIDLVRAIIDYDGVELTGTTAAPQPTLTVTVDGKTTDAPVTLQAEKRTDGHSYFLATLVAPNAVSGNIHVDVAVNAGYATSVPTVLSTAQPISAVSLLSREPGASCLSVLSGQPPDPALGLDAPCSDAAPAQPSFRAGVQPLELVIDYGAIDFPAASKIPAPTVNVLVDGADSSTPVLVSPAFRHGGHIFFTATLHPPSRVSSDVRLVVTATPGASQMLDPIFDSIAPTITVAVLECPGLACARAGGVGTVHAQVTVDGDVPQLVGFHNLVNALPIADSAASQMTSPGLGTTSASAEIPVPTVAPGSTWIIEAQIGPLVAPSQSIAIGKPTITTALSCSSPCTVAPGTLVGLTVTAPQGIAGATALVNTAINGVPDLTGATFGLAADNDDGTVTTSLTLTAPATTGNWTISVSVDGYSADTQLVSVQ